MSKIENAVQWMLGIAADNTHGYSQSVRWGPSYDCSSLVISAFEQAGVPVKSRGATYTETMLPAFLACGFKDVTSTINLATGSGLQRGDVLLNIVNHTALYIGNGQIVHARSSEGTSDTADNSGNEIRTQGYWNYPWDKVLRFAESDSTPIASGGTVSAGTTTPASTASATVTAAVALPVLKRGCVGNGVKRLQQILIADGISCGPDGADGDFGGNTNNAVMEYQRKHGLTADGICGKATWEKLMCG